jgi:hypothetical protein
VKGRTLIAFGGNLQWQVRALSSAFIGTFALADKLPKGAVPLTPNEIKAVYSDHSADWSAKNKALFAADGSVKGIAGDSFFSGKYGMKGNQICMEVQATNSKTKVSDGKTYSDCWEWNKVGKAYWTFHSKSYDNKPMDRMKGWYKSEIKKLKKGDLVSAKYPAMGGK